MRSHPIRELVVKLHERCNLACDHCYMYEAADQSWRDRPVAMAPATIRRVAMRLADHAMEHRLDGVRVVFHGGEPLLVGTGGMDLALKQFHDLVGAHTGLSFGVQTNGVLLDDEFLALFRRHRVRVGISIDGDRRANDRHRRYANGRSSYEGVVRGIRMLARGENREIYGGLLCTVELSNDPIETYLSLLAHQPPRIDFLLPHGNWEFPPPALDQRTVTAMGGTPYADWLIAIFDYWYDSTGQTTEIRLFDSIISLLLGGASDTEAVGAGVPTSVVVETDGSIEGNDALKTTGPNGGAIGFTVFAQSFDDVIAHPSIAAARQGLAGLGPTCRSCPIVGVCGGGLFAHRFSTDEGFDRPSVYCGDLFLLVGHIRRRVETELRGHLAAPTVSGAV